MESSVNQSNELTSSEESARETASVSLMCVDQDTRRTLQEYETQYFGFTPKSFCNGVYNAALEFMQTALQKMEDDINKEYGSAISASEVKAGKNKILSHMLTRLNQNFDLLEVFVSDNVFKIPDHVVLPENLEQAKGSHSVQEEEDLDEEIQSLKNKIIAYRFANKCLGKEIENLDKAQGVFDAVAAKLEKLSALIENKDGSDVKALLISTREKTIEMMKKMQFLFGKHVEGNVKKQ